MKTVTQIFIFIFLFTGFLQSQTGWFVLNHGTGEYFRNVYFINEQTGFIPNWKGILKTTNGGYNWSEKTLPDSSVIYSIRFINQLTGYACGGRSVDQYESKQHLFKTTNAGDNWTLLHWSNAVMSQINFYDVFASGNNICISSGGYHYSYNSTGSISLSTNSGGNFLYVLTALESFTSLSFVNSQTGWASSQFFTDVPYGEKKIYKTTNSGQNWIMQYKDTSLNMGLENAINYVQFLNLNTGYFLYGKSGKAKLAKTTNGGSNWDTSLYNHNKYEAMYFADANTGWIGGRWFYDTVVIMRTTNGSQSWEIQKKGIYGITSIHFINNLTGWAVGMNGLILKTITGGVTSIKNISSEIPNAFSLEQNYPNPFNSITNVKFQIPNSGDVKLTVFDMLGKEVAILVNEYLQPGTYETTFDASMLTSGIYFYRLETEKFTETKKLILLK